MPVLMRGSSAMNIGAHVAPLGTSAVQARRAVFVVT